jgi:arginine/ornithine N-succinyltransferase beta subunit
MSVRFYGIGLHGIGAERPARASKEDEARMAIESEVDKLCGTLVEGISGLNKKVEQANALFGDTMKEADETVQLVMDQGNTLKGALAKLRASIGVNTNFPPKDETQA